ncbi:MAG: response regulator [Nitrosopumilus sp.]|nr:MAG: response regulator [Nitrosopumilus sp.]
MEKSTKIMLVDDDSDYLEVTQLMLMDEGYDVIPAINGEDGVVKYKESEPDIVFLDIKMPGIDGYETFFRIKKVDSDARIVFASSYALENEKYKKAKEMNLCGIINKPAEFDEYEKMINKFAKSS